MRRARLLVALLALVGVAAGCGRTEASRPSAGPGATELRGRLTVLAAASLRESLAAVVSAFEARHPAVTVAVTADGSARLAAAIVEGAPADVFASADQANLDTVVAAGLAGPPTVIATNELEIVVADGNPRRITGLADLARPDVVTALCAAVEPCGAYAQQAFAKAGLGPPVASEEPSVSGVLTRVQLGEADAGVVYATDVVAAAGVDGVRLRPTEQVRVTYPAAVLTEAVNPAAATAFVAFLTSDAGQAILRAHGFGAP